MNKSDKKNQRNRVASSDDGAQTFSKTRGKHLFLLPVFYLVAIVCFAYLPNTFVNYGYNYVRFTHVWFGAVLIGVLLLLCCVNTMFLKDKKHISLKYAWVVVLIVAPFLMWCFRTDIHCFGGDGAVGGLPGSALQLRDFIPRGKRLDGYLGGVLFKVLNGTPIFENYLTMPSILRTQIYSVILGGVFVAATSLFFRKQLSMLLMVLTFPYIFNFFGNIDSYAFSVFYALIFTLVCIRVATAKTLEWFHLLMLMLLWGIGLWTHPFHLFSGFMVAYFFAVWFNGAQKKITFFTPTLSVVLYGIALFVFIKVSRFSNRLFDEHDLLPAAFSADTLTHYLNAILLPLIPLFIALLMRKRKDKDVGCGMPAGPFVFMFVMGSCSFFTMAFTLGACDQFNYAHLMLFFLMPWLVYLSTQNLSAMVLRNVVLANLFLLIPMVVVHSTDRTIDRAQYVYPLDPCRHNRVMSWQTHLGLCLGDNFSENPKVATALLETFKNGALHAQPPQFRFGNYVYFVAYHYHFGKFDEGKILLEKLLKQYPQGVQFFFSERPAMIFFNRQKLWNDVLELYPAANMQEKRQLADVVATVQQQAEKTIYYKKRPSFAKTEF